RHHTALFFLGQASFISALVLFFVAGLRTARTEAKLRSPAIAGLIAALMVWVVDIAIRVVNVQFLYSSTIATLASEERLVAGWSGWGGGEVRGTRAGEMGEERGQFGRWGAARPALPVCLQPCPRAEPAAHPSQGSAPDDPLLGPAGDDRPRHCWS